jgi:hypothetical protein
MVPGYLTPSLHGAISTTFRESLVFRLPKSLTFEQLLKLHKTA